MVSIFMFDDILLLFHAITQIQASGQHIKVFNKLQIECRITEPLKIPLHSNIQWGTAYLMHDQLYKLHKACSSPFFIPSH